MSLFPRLQELMLKYRFRPQQKLSQNFCIDERLIERAVAEAALTKKDTVLEIGCGTGFLTEKLLEAAGKVIGVELDEQMLEVLRDRFASEKNFELVEGSFTDKKIGTYNKIVSFPPYSLSDDLALRLVQNPPELVVLAFQREFAEKLSAFPGFKEYSYLAVITHLVFDVEVPIVNVSPKSFFPKPVSYSSLIVLRKNGETKIPDMERFIFFLRSIFRFRNKSVLNASKSCVKELERNLGVSAEKIEKVVSESDVAGEKIGLVEPEDFLKIFESIIKK